MKRLINLFDFIIYVLRYIPDSLYFIIIIINLIYFIFSVFSIIFEKDKARTWVCNYNEEYIIEGNYPLTTSKSQGLI